MVSANKKLIAEHLDELLELKDQYGVSFLYEASVCASIPIIRNLEEYYNNDSLTDVAGICNGTTNYILTRLNNERGMVMSRKPGPRSSKPMKVFWHHSASVAGSSGLKRRCGCRPFDPG